MMNSKIVYIALLVAALVACIAYAADPQQVQVAATGTAPTPDCPVQRSVNYMSSLWNRVRNMGGSSSSVTKGE